MKKLIILVLALACALGLAGCGDPEAKVDPGELIAYYTGDDVTKVDIRHVIGSQFTDWTVEGEDVSRLKAWLAGLEFGEGQPPGEPVGGGESHSFALPEGDLPGIGYVSHGPGECFLVIEGILYPVVNPSDPPVTFPRWLITTYMNDDVTKVKVSYVVDGRSRDWTVEGNVVSRLKDWLYGLEYGGMQPPGDLMGGGEAFYFTLPDGELPKICYVNQGPDKCFLVVEDRWYPVVNPSDPPVVLSLD